MNKLFLLILCFVTLNIFAAEAEPRWGVSLGFGSTSWESDKTYTTGDYAGQNTKYDADFNPTILGIDMSIGKHSVALSSAGSSAEDFSTSGSYTSSSSWTGRIGKLDLDDVSITYGYRINDNWSVGVGWNQVDSNWETWRYYPLDASGVAEVFFAGGEAPTDFRVVREATSKDERSGLTVVGSYATTINDKWVFVGKLGLAQQDYDSRIDYDYTYTGLPALYDSCITGGACPPYVNPPVPLGTMVNGDGYDGIATESSSSTAAIIGFSFIYIIDAKHSITFDFSTRTNDYGDSNLDQNQTPRGGWLTEGEDDFTATVTGQKNDIEEYFSSLSVKWRYALN